MADGRRLVVVGASLAGLRAVEAARRLGHEGDVVLVGGETHLPYDRPPLSKELLAPSDDAPADPTHAGALRLTGELDVELRLGIWATGVDVEAHALETDNGRMPYDALVLATGSQARSLDGTHGRDRVHGLRTLEDARAIRSALDDGARTVVVGAGLIGSEVASAARARDLEVTVVDSAPTPLARAVGEDVGRLLVDLHRDAGTHVRLGVGVDAVVGDGRVEAVRLDDGDEIGCDLVVVGVGASPATGWLESAAGIELDDGVLCDATLRAAEDVWAAGDIARWPNRHFDDRMVRLENWTSAAEQGLHAARNALAPDTAKEYRTVPYFWSDWYGHRLQHVGLPDADDVEVLRGESDGLVALYRTGERLTGAFTLDRPGLTHKLRRHLLQHGSFDDARELALSKL